MTSGLAVCVTVGWSVAALLGMGRLIAGSTGASVSVGVGRGEEEAVVSP